MTELFPSTLEELHEEGARFADLYLQGGWGRAALAYGCTTNTDKGGRPKRGDNSPGFPMGVKAFGRLGIPGLTDPKTIRHYREMWVWAIEQGLAEDIKPGVKYELPDMDWDEAKNNKRNPEPAKPGTFTIPTTVDGLVSRLNELVRVSSDSHWRLAAIVWLANDQGWSTDQLARQNDLPAYISAWQWAIDNLHASPVEPGGGFSIPNLYLEVEFGEWKVDRW